MKWVFANSKTLQIPLHCGQNICRKLLKVYCWSVRHPAWDISSPQTWN